MKVETVEQRSGPTTGAAAIWRLTHDKNPGRRQDRDGGAQHGLGWTEAAGDHRIDSAGKNAGERGRFSGEHGDLILAIEPVSNPLKMVCARRPAIDQHHLHVGPHPGDHQTGYATAATKVDDRARDVDQRGEERPAMFDDLGDWRGAQHAEPLRPGQRLDERFVVEPRCAGQIG